jgi:type II secretory pathway pseudopilin PulG
MKGSTIDRRSAWSSSTRRRSSIHAGDPGFTIVQLLVAIVLIGIVATVALIGAGRLTDQASATGCTASADAARTAVNAYLVSNARYPISFAELTQPAGVAGASLDVPASAAVAGSRITVGNWSLTMSAAAPPTFTCTAAATEAAVVDTAHLSGWTFIDDNGKGGSGQFVTGPAPSGSGSAQLNIAGNTQGFTLSNSTFGSTRLDRLTSLTYSTFQPAGILAPALQFDIRFRPLDTGYAGRLVYEPYDAVGTVGAGWQSWSALDGRWWASYSASAANQPTGSHGLCTQATPCSWAQILIDFPDAVISPGGRLNFKVGSGWGAAPLSFNVDAFTIGVAGDDGLVTETTYDFEPTAGP